MTIDGRVENIDGIVVPVVHVWRDYLDRNKGCSMHLKHGAKVKVITEYPDYVKIKRWFRTGFINKQFIAELKNG